MEEQGTRPSGSTPPVPVDTFDLTIEDLRELAGDVAYSCGSSGSWGSYWTGSCSCGCSCSCSCSCSCDW